MHVQSPDGVRRSKRTRHRPLEYWNVRDTIAILCNNMQALCALYFDLQGERRTYERRNSGVGVFMPTPQDEVVTDQMFVDLEAVQLEKQKKRKARKKGKPKKKKALKKSKDEDEEDEEESEDEDQDFNTKAWVLDSMEEKDVYKAVVKTKSMIKMDYLGQVSEGENPVPKERLPKVPTQD